MKKSFKTAFLYMVIIALIVLFGAGLMNTASEEEMTYGKVKDLFKNEQVKSFVIDPYYDNLDMVIRVQLPDGTEGERKISYRLRDVEMFLWDLSDTIEDQHSRGIIAEYDIPAPAYIPWWVSLLPSLLMIALLIGAFIFFMRQTTGGGSSRGGGRVGGVGRAKAKLVTDDKNRVYFKDVAGADEEKAELEEIVEFLRDPGYFTKLGAKIPHGVLLVGPPGTGKTLIAKAVAGEAGVPFYSISGSDFVELYVGVGASRVRDLFDTARKNPAAIIFIDEIDAVGRHRGAGLGGGHDEREQTLNQILVEMDGFGTSDAVIVMAATNRPDILDPALLRPGRFDRQITMNPPDVRGREEILKVHSKNKPLESDVDLSKIAQSTVGFTGAELANLLNESALLAARKGKSLIGMTDIEEAMIKVIVGIAKTKNRIKPKEKMNTAYHEAGHAIVSFVLPELDPVRRISIVPTGRALGYTLTSPEEDKFSVYKTELQAKISELLGGRVAERMIFGNYSGGASNDIERATSIAKTMVMKLGMSDKLGPILYGSEHSSDEVFLGRDFNNSKNYSDETAAIIDSEIKRIIDEAYAETERILTENIGKLHFIAEYLVKNEVMEEDQFRRAMEEDGVTIEDLELMVAEKKLKSEEDNRRREKHLKELEAKRQAEREAAEKKADSWENPYPMK